MAIVPITLTAKTEQEQTEIATAVCEARGVPVTIANVKKAIIEFIQGEVNRYRERTVKKEPLGIE